MPEKLRSRLVSPWASMPAAFWAFAPLSLAMTLGTAVIAAGLAVTLIYSFRLRSRAQA